MLASSLDKMREQARASTLEAALQQQQARVQIQAHAASLEKSLDPDVADLADHFHLDEMLARSLEAALDSRGDSYESDFLAVWEALEKATNPAEALVGLIRRLIDGTFIVKSRKHTDIVKLCETYRLDHMATNNLIAAMAIRERDADNDIERDLEDLEVHLAHSNAPSKLISMKLKELRAGCKINAVWHCCGDSKKKPSSRAKESPVDGGIGIEGVRGRGSGQGTYKAYTDHQLEQRDHEINRKFGSSGSGAVDTSLMTEEQALNFQHTMRREKRSREDARREDARREDARRDARREDARREDRSYRSRSRGGGHGRGRSRSRSRDRRGHNRRD